MAVGFTYLFGLEHTGAHALMVASLAGGVALGPFPTAAPDHPLFRSRPVGPEAF